MAEALPPQERETSPEELIVACADVLEEDDRVFIKDCELDEALGYVCGLMVNAGIADPEAELVKRGLLRSQDEI